MKRTAWFTLGLFVSWLAIAFAASEATIDNQIKDLRSNDPEVRAKAAYDLGCG